MIKLKIIVNKRLTSEEKPIRLSMQKIGEMTRIKDGLKNQLENMPQSKNLIESILESKHEYYIRIVKWAANQLNLNSEGVTAKEILHVAGISGALSQEVTQEIERQVYALIRIATNFIMHYIWHKPLH